MPGTPPVANAAPVSVILGSNAHGSFVDVVVSATDADNLTGSATFPVKDGAGNITNAVVSIVLSDPLSFDPAVLSANLVGKVTASRISVAADGLSSVWRLTVV